MTFVVFATSMLAACGAVSSNTLVAKRELLRHVPSFRNVGQARVETTTGKSQLVEASTKVEIFRDGKKIEVTIASLLEGCPDVPPFEEDSFHSETPCPMEELFTANLVVGQHSESTNWSSVGSAVGLVAGIGVVSTLSYCAFECTEEGIRYPATATLGLGALYGLYLAITDHNSSKSR